MVVPLSCKQLGLLVLSVVVSLVAAVLATWLAWNEQPNGDPLQDPAFDILPNWSNIEFPIVNLFVICQYVIGALAFKKRTKYVAQFIFVQCVITFLRALTVSISHIPNIHVYEYCKTRPTGFIEVLHLMITHGTCADYMFSGHTATSLLALLFTVYHGNRKCCCCGKYVAITISLILFVLTVVFLLLQRWHYTMDILIATIITVLLFYLYKIYDKQEKKWFYFNYEDDNGDSIEAAVVDNSSSYTAYVIKF
mgnify:CR=1 FL=1|tara:strand:+ start:271 stop:1023 length:753 start_codon:yes stop_codon:yes gene_type:complete